MSTHPLKKIGPASRPHVERLRAICMALPEVAEKIAWGTPTWRVGGAAGRVFAQLADHHHGNPHLAVWLAAPEGAQQALIEAEPSRFFRPAYVGHLGWVAAILDEQADWQMVEAVVRQAHRVSAAKLGRKQAAMILAMAGEATPAKKPRATPAKKPRATPAKRSRATPAKRSAPPARAKAKPPKKPAARPASKRSAATARR